MALTWDGTLIRCDGSGCGASERVPAWLLENDDMEVEAWLVHRAWATVGGRHYCPEHW